MCAENFQLVSMGGRAEGQSCADPGARTPIGTSGNFLFKYYINSIVGAGVGTSDHLLLSLMIN